MTHYQKLSFSKWYVTAIATTVSTTASTGINIQIFNSNMFSPPRTWGK